MSNFHNELQDLVFSHMDIEGVQKLMLDMISLISCLCMTVPEGDKRDKERGFRIGWIITQFIKANENHDTLYEKEGQDEQ